MKKFLAGVATLAMVAGGSTAAFAQNVTTLDSDASATIENPFNIAEDFALNFGTIIAGGAADTVTLNPADGTITAATGNVTLDGAEQLGVFTINGIGSGVTLTVSGTATLVDGAGTGTDMVATLVTEPADTSALAFVDDVTPLTVEVGGDLAVNAEQAAGTYTGTYTVAFDFN